MYSHVGLLGIRAPFEWATGGQMPLAKATVSQAPRAWAKDNKLPLAEATGSGGDGSGHVSARTLLSPAVRILFVPSCFILGTTLGDGKTRRR